MGKQIRILQTQKLFAVREEQRGCSRRAARSFAKSSAVVRERQIKTTRRKREIEPKNKYIRT